MGVVQDYMWSRRPRSHSVLNIYSCGHSQYWHKGTMRYQFEFPDVMHNGALCGTCQKARQKEKEADEAKT